MAATPANKLSIFYKDIDLGLRAHPVTGALLTKKNAESVKQGLRNLILTNYYERPYLPDYGGNIRQHLFELFDVGTVQDVERDIEYAFNSYIKRAELIEANVTADVDGNALTITIVFRPINSVKPEEVTVTVDRIR